MSVVIIAAKTRYVARYATDNLLISLVALGAVALLGSAFSAWLNLPVVVGVVVLCGLLAFITWMYGRTSSIQITEEHVAVRQWAKTIATVRRGCLVKAIERKYERVVVPVPFPMKGRTVDFVMEDGKVAFSVDLDLYKATDVQRLAEFLNLEVQWLPASD